MYNNCKARKEKITKSYAGIHIIYIFTFESSQKICLE